MQDLSFGVSCSFFFFLEVDISMDVYQNQYNLKVNKIRKLGAWFAFPKLFTGIGTSPIYLDDETIENLGIRKISGHHKRK